MFADALPDWVNTTSPRVGAGLGTIARVVASGEAIYRGKLRFAEAQARVRECWQPYHDALAGLIGETREAFGGCLLIDCHSMPAGSGRAAARPDFVLGDAHGTACTPHVTALVEQVLTGCGYDVRRNDPYAGGYVTRHYGRPREGVHALQIEVARRPLHGRSSLEKGAGFAARAGAACRPARAGSAASGGLLSGAGKKKAAPCGTAKFREETSKKQEGRSRCCDGQAMTADPRLQAFFCSAADS